MNNKSESNFEIGWIKTHARFLGNERADLLDKSVILEGTFDMEASVKVLITYIKRLFMNKVLQEQQQY